MGAVISQFFFIPKPPVTAQNCPDQRGRVFIVTGGYAGVGFELCQILYERNATVYIAGHSQSKAPSAILRIKKVFPNSAGRLDFLDIDLSDFSTIKLGVHSFLAEQDRLDVLINNAGIMLKGSNDPRHNEVHIGTNCVGPSLLYKLLLPTLVSTATLSPTASVRVLWTASIAVHVNAPKPGGMEVEDNGRPKDTDVLTSYGQSKVGNVFLAQTYAKKTPQTGVVHVAFNPGNLSTELQRHWHGMELTLMRKLLFFPAVYGAYTELWAALSPDVTPERSGAYIYPWGRFGSLPSGIEASLKEPSEGGTGLANKFSMWCEKQTEAYL